MPLNSNCRKIDMSSPLQSNELLYRCRARNLIILCFSIILQYSHICHSVPDPNPPPPFTNNQHYCGSERCGDFNAIPFPFYLNPSCHSFSDAFRLFCTSNSTTSLLFLTIASQSYQVHYFFPDNVSLLIDNFPNRTSPSPSPSPSCRPYINDLTSFNSFQGSNYFTISTDNVLGLYDCDDSSACKAEDHDCEKINAAAAGICHNNNTTNSRACCYPLSDPTIWNLGDGFSAFSLFGCRGFSSWVVSGFNDSSPKRGVKLEWAVPSNSIKGACDSNARIVNATSGRMRCQCLEGFVGDGFALGLGCLKTCLISGKEAYGRDCYVKEHGRKTMLLLAGVLTAFFSIASLAALFCMLKGRHTKSDSFNHDQSHGISFRKACKTHLFTHQELEEATNGFDDSQKLVDINNGTIYAGVLEDGSHLAVHKVHCACERDLLQALSRVEVLYAVSHRSVARLLGCCIDYGYTPLVVYEYPANGTLEEHLRQSKEQKISIDWHKRLNIAFETASVLSFLQCEIFPPIFHHDLQSGCILLDEDYSVKLAGFELFCEDEYPDFAQAAQLNMSRSDVYSLGVVLLEIITGGRSGDLPTIGLHKIRSGKVEEIVDPLLYYHEQSGMRREQIEAVADLATRCLLFGGDGKLRMNDVARELAHIGKESDNCGSRRGPSLEETFSNSSLLQMISMSPDSIYLP